MLCAKIGIKLERFVKGEIKIASKFNLSNYVKDDMNPNKVNFENRKS